MQILHLYRPRLPEMRAQAIQVLHTCHALATLGHEVTLIADREATFKGDATEALAAYGLEPVTGLRLQLAAHSHPTAAGIEFRAELLRWLLTRRDVRDRPILYARSKRLSLRALRLQSLLPFRLVLEAHEVDSLQAQERGEDPRLLRSLEARVLGRAEALVTNCEGTMALLESTHAGSLPAPRRVIHNGTHPERARLPPLPSLNAGPRVAGYVGSIRAYKEVRALGEAAPLLPEGIVLRVIGGHETDPGLDALVRYLSPRLRWSPGVPYTEVPERLGELHALVLCLGNDLYARRLASPLKLWDYLATDRPLVLPELPSIRDIVGDDPGEGMRFYMVGDAPSLARAIEEAVRSPPRAPRVRSWQDRAREIDALLAERP
jgi:glycosyltransferase involved in cell wall biosynthesis